MRTSVCGLSATRLPKAKMEGGRLKMALGRAAARPCHRQNSIRVRLCPPARDTDFVACSRKRSLSEFVVKILCSLRFLLWKGTARFWGFRGPAFAWLPPSPGYGGQDGGQARTIGSQARETVGRTPHCTGADAPVMLIP